MLDTVREMRAPAFAPRREPLPLPPGNCFVRLLTAKVIASVTRRSLTDIAAAMWPQDRLVAEVIERAISNPAMTTTAGWAAELSQRVVMDMVDALGPVSAGAQLFRECLVASFDGAGQIAVPALVADVTDAAWVAEGDPIPVAQNATAAVVLSPHKIGTIAVLTREMIESSNAERLIADVLTRSAGLALDSALFDANASSAARPAGLRNGISTLTPSAITDFYQAAIEDVGNLMSAVGAVGGAGPYFLITSPGHVASMSMRFVDQVRGLTMLGSPAAGSLMIAVAAQAVAAAFSPNPDVESSKAATLVMNDVGTPVVTGGVTGAPARGLWQTDSIAVKIRWPATWALRDARGVAWTTPAYK